MPPRKTTSTTDTKTAENKATEAKTAEAKTTETPPNSTASAAQKRVRDVEDGVLDPREANADASTALFDEVPTAVEHRDPVRNQADTLIPKPEDHTATGEKAPLSSFYMSQQMVEGARSPVLDSLAYPPKMAMKAAGLDKDDDKKSTKKGSDSK